MNYQTIAATDPWSNYTDQYGKKLPVPEPAEYGVMLSGSILLICFLRRFRRK